MNIVAHGAGVALLLVGLASLGGCGPKEEPSPSTAPAPSAAPVEEDIVARFRRLAPGAIIGRVTGAQPDASLVAVSGVPLVDFQEGDIVTFYGAGDVQLGTGEVVRTTGNALIVRYGQPPAGGRAPAPGDVMIRFPNR